MSLKCEERNVEPLSIIPHTNEDASDKTSICELCTQLVEEWKRFGVQPSDIALAKVDVGITNQIYYATAVIPDEGSLKRNKVVVRIFGGVGTDRAREDRILARLSQAKVAPEFIGRFGNGRIEGWLDGRNLLLDEMRLPDIMTQIAWRMAEMHRVDIPGEKKSSKVWETIGTWVRIAKKVKEGEEKWRVGALEDWENELILLKRIVDKECKESPVVFCHNDVHPTNLYIGGENGRTVSLLDFEYGDYNYRGFDIGNFFCECMGGLEDAIVRPEKYPNHDQQMHFCKAYLCAYYGNKEYDNSTLLELKDEANQFGLVSHIYWGMWALCQSVASTVDFDYTLFARNRLAEFRRVRDRYLRPRSIRL
eukprot:Plantae.Rhodophyta-Hildenbrandia_rubra.ctg47073.p1 GENE.Plantae.Rhodophyta-Hildenbrandia_rubra.ctg47073~~Plantae.Rhodophyta-Hildenbrandia_rubra.ctg47073.p1  ORF type:complete len:364 (+),score=60.53 Plantae.Rhodophyta-Hildenbrandia_rubra.ctg47073:166-1257(+)